MHRQQDTVASKNTVALRRHIAAPKNTLAMTSEVEKERIRKRVQCLCSVAEETEETAGQAKAREATYQGPKRAKGQNTTLPSVRSTL
jgi:hypothetical protein